MKKLLIMLMSFGGLFLLLLVGAPADDVKRYTDDVIEEASVSAALDESEDDEELPSDELPELAPNHSGPYDVVRVVDGDTVRIMLDGTETTLRLIGMNTPETVDPRTTVECFGKEASNKAKELLSSTRITLELDEREGGIDKYGRTLAYLYMDDGVMFNEWMIKNGYAYEYTYDDVYKYQSEFKAAEHYARQHELGLWSSDTCSGKLEF